MGTLLTGAVLAAAATAIYVVPPQSQPRPADVIYVIGPVHPWRLILAAELVSEGISDEVLISIPAGGEDSIKECRDGIAGARVTCEHPEPSTTQGEARDLAAYMDANNAESALVITSTPHLARTQVRMDNCAEGEVQVIGKATGLGLGDWAYQIVYQTAAFAKLAFTNRC